MMKKIFGLLFVFTISLNAQTSKEKVQELIKEMQADKMISQVMDQMVPMMQQQIKASLKTEEQKQKLEKINTILFEEVKSFTKEMVNGPMVTIYAKHFSNKDINNLIKFYKGKTGKKLIELTPVISKELMQTMMQNEIPEFQKRIKERIKNIETK
ncbi:DUF2059 domain-containing protein [Wenyingzhuangia aestuarii]|uniref:DUF2059 domain-containing protein n=1 Tax=Wenyingzhuangia aestuarii TaxID=1647582 RepID=UPI00143C058D|nr:DUF2059 domain-containing protein [Wenyingzhuangia aestuarii]NJB81958.1 hypothetical protein [Wenyingzhuangia aestuarii]